MRTFVLFRQLNRAQHGLVALPPSLYQTFRTLFRLGYNTPSAITIKLILTVVVDPDSCR